MMFNLLQITIPIGEKIFESNPGIAKEPGTIVSNLASLLLIAASIAAFLYLIYGGFKWLTSSGDKGKLEEAQATITNAIIGLVIIAASWAVFVYLNSTLGIGIDVTETGQKQLPGGKSP